MKKNCVSNMQYIKGFIPWCVYTAHFTPVTNSDHAEHFNADKSCTHEEVHDIYTHLFLGKYLRMSYSGCISLIVRTIRHWNVFLFLRKKVLQRTSQVWIALCKEVFTILRELLFSVEFKVSTLRTCFQQLLNFVLNFIVAYKPKILSPWHDSPCWGCIRHVFWA